MSDFDLASQRLREALTPGQHSLNNAQLRDIYGLGRVSAKARREIIVTLSAAGLEVQETSPTTLVVRRRASEKPGKPDRPLKTRRPWWSLKRTWVAAAVLISLLFLIPGEAEKPNTDQAVAASKTPAATTTPALTPAPTPTRKDVVGDARDAVADDDYQQALVLVAALGDDDHNLIRRTIGRSVRYRVRRALRQGNRTTARGILRSSARQARHSSGYRSARSALAQADEAARQRRAAARAARAAARAARAAARRAREQAAADRRAAAAAAQAAEDAAEQAAEAPDASGGYTGNCDSSPSDIPVAPGSDGDRDGDGVACES